MHIICEIGSGWAPNKYPLSDAVKAALDCGADFVKLQFFSDARQLAMRRGGVSGLEEWQLKARYVVDLAEKLKTEYQRPVLGVSVFHPDDVLALAQAKFDRGSHPLALIKIATQEFQYAALAEAASRFSAAQEVPMYVSIPPSGCLCVGNFWSPFPITWMACVPHYPAKADDYSLAQVGAMLDSLPGKVGLSDHVPDASLLQKFKDHLGVLSACEKHFIYDERLRGQVPDGGPWSLSQADFKAYVEIAHREGV